jgi:transposase
MQDIVAYIGIDAAKSFHVVCIKDATKRSLIPPITITDDDSGFEQLRHCLDKLKDKHNIHVFAAGVEATGTYHLRLVGYLRSCPDIQLTILNPIQTKHFLLSDLRRASTDKVSAEVIAQFIAEKTPAVTHLVSDQYQTAKYLVQRMHSLTEQKSATINRLREHLALLWPELERKQPDFNAKQLLALLTIAQTPERAQSVDFVQNKKITILGTTYTLRADFIKNIQELLKAPQQRYVRSGNEPIIKSLAEETLFLLHQIDQMTEALRQLFALKDEQPILESIHGVGETTAIVATAFIGDPNRFRSAKQAVAYFGLNPRIKESGTSVHGKGYIQKKGNSLVRYYLYNCVLSMIRKKNHPLAIFYRRLCKKGKCKMVALVACMKKLVVIMLAMLKSNTKFSMNYATRFSQ